MSSSSSWCNKINIKTFLIISLKKIATINDFFFQNRVVRGSSWVCKPQKNNWKSVNRAVIQHRDYYTTDK